MPHVETKMGEGADPMALADKCISHRGCGWGEREHILRCVQEAGHLRALTKACLKVRTAVLGAMGRSRKGEGAYWVQQSPVPILCSVSSFCWAGEHYGHGQCDVMTLPKPRWYINRPGWGQQREKRHGERLG